MNKHNIHSLALLLTLLLATSISHAQTDKDTTDTEPNFRIGKMIFPIVIASVGSTGLINNSPLEVMSYETRDFVLANKHRTHIDDYLQYAPISMHTSLAWMGAKAKHNFADRTIASANAYICMAGLINGMKYSIRELRPDASTRNSFPSGHTATAFTGAELTRIEYGNKYGIIAYSAATMVGFARVYNNRHWVHDVVTGAGIGILSARVGYWMLPVWKNAFGYKDEKDFHFSMAPNINPHSKEYSLNVCMLF